MATIDQLNRIETLAYELGNKAASFYHNEWQVIEAAQIEDVIPNNVSTYRSLSVGQADDLLQWLREAETEAAGQKVGLFEGAR